MLRPGKKFYKHPSLIAATMVLLLAFLTVPTALVLTARAETKAAAEHEGKPTKSLHQATANGDIEQVKSLISKGADSASTDEPKQTSDSDLLAFAADQAKKVAGKRKLLVTSKRTGNFEIFLMNEDGTEAKNLTNHEAEDSGPAWSPDGKRIVFSSNRSGDFDIYVMNADGSGVRQLTTDSRKDGWPAWSPDGKTITFTRSMDPSNYLTGDIFTIKPDATGEKNLTDNPAHDGDATWSPDGKRIVFSSTRGGGAYHFQLYVMGSDGKDIQRLLEKRIAYAYPAWSPDGNKLVFGSSAPGGRSIELFLYNFESGKNRQLTTLGGLNTYPAWSPDGKKIAFQHHIPFGKPGTLHIMDADGSNLKKIFTDETHARYGGGRPAWKPK